MIGKKLQKTHTIFITVILVIMNMEIDKISGFINLKKKISEILQHQIVSILTMNCKQIFLIKQHTLPILIAKLLLLEIIRYIYLQKNGLVSRLPFMSWTQQSVSKQLFIKAL